MYLPHGGKCRLTPERADTGLVYRWFNPRNGEFHGGTLPLEVGRQELNAPDEADWVLLAQTREVK